MRLLLFIFLLALALVVQAPAWFVARQVSDASTQTVELRDTSGTVWNGRGEVIVHGLTGRQANAGPISWKLRRFDLDRKAWIVDVAQRPLALPSPPLALRSPPLALPSSPLALQSSPLALQSDPPALALRPLNIAIGAGFNRVEIAGAIRIAPEIIGVFPMLSGWTLSGDAVAELSPLEVTRRGATGNAVMQWQRARLTPPDFPAGFDLGSVSGSATLTTTGDEIRLRNTGGDIALTIEGSSRARTITLTAAPRPTTSPAQLSWLQSHTMSRTPAGGFRVDAGWPGR